MPASALCWRHRGACQGSRRSLRRAPSWVVLAGRYLSPHALELDQPSRWRQADLQADYLIVAHPRLLAALAPLVALRRSQGLTVAEIDVRDVYDEWSGGVTDPRAIRDFVDFAFHHWRAPAPRFLLLVGDASWDGKNEHPVGASPDWAFRLSDRAEFIENGSTPYRSDVLAASRNLVPTWGYGSAEGHAAGDNAFVAIDGEDEFPDLAVGRFPVIDPHEVEAIVAKIVAYEQAPEPGDWRSRILWVTNEESRTQKTSDDLCGGARAARLLGAQDLSDARGAADLRRPDGVARRLRRRCPAGALLRPRRALHLAHGGARSGLPARPLRPLGRRGARVHGQAPARAQHDLLLGAVRSSDGGLDRREAPARAGKGRGGGLRGLVAQRSARGVEPHPARGAAAAGDGGRGTRAREAAGRITSI